MSQVGLEPDFTSGNGLSHSFRFRLVTRSFGFSVCSTVVSNRIFFTDLELPTTGTEFTVFHGLLRHEQGFFWIRRTEDTKIFAIPQMDLTGLYRVVEACSGIGAVDQGYTAAGATTVCYIDNNACFTHWLNERGFPNVITGNVAHANTTMQAMQAVPQSHIVSGGFSCQPFSGLGDQLQEKDPRSESLPGILRLAHHMGSLAVILECTKEAAESAWVQLCLQEFQAASGYTCTQQILHLQSLWPANRTRWWAILAHPCLGQVVFDQLPGLRFQPAVTHLVPRMLNLDDEEHQQLQLDDYELEVFREARGGMEASMFNPLKTMPTATHSLGSQACPCECGCRTAGFSRQRLREKGLHAIIMVNKQHDKLRHPHPVEISLCNGLLPSHVAQKTSLKLLLAGVGQMASPFQGAWALSSLLRSAFKAGLMPEPRHPRLIMLDMCHALLRERDRWWPDLQNTIPMKIFLHEIIALVSPVTYVASWEEDEPTTQEWKQACEAAEATIAKDNEASTEATREVGVAAAKSKSSGPKPSCAPNLKFPGMIETTQIPQSTETNHGEEGNQAKTKSSVIDEASFKGGAVPGFGTRAFEPSVKATPPPEKEARHVSTPQATQLTESEAETDQVSEPLAKRAKVVDTATVEMDDTRAEAAENLVDPIQPSVFHVVRRDQEVHTVTCIFPVKVSQIVQAENELTIPVASHVSDLAGLPIASHSEVCPGQFIMIDPRIPCHCPKTAAHVGPSPMLKHMSRSAALWQQQGWVAVDEMAYYMKAVCHDAPRSNFGVINLIDDEDFTETFTEQILQAAQAAKEDPQEPRRAIAVLHEHHWTPIMLQATRGKEAIAFTTTPDMKESFRAMINKHVGNEDFQFFTKPIPRDFPADCGFQAVAWLLGICHQYEPEPMTVHQAGQWRALFHRELVYRNHDQDMLDKPLPLGGAKQAKEQLVQLLTQHGVANTRGSECADHLIHTLSLATIQQILQSPRPWQDLKARASMHRPPVRIVLADELKQQIAARAGSKKPIGRKQNKLKSEGQSKPTLLIPPEQIIIPHAVFKQDDGQEVGQITMQELGPKSRGVWVASVQEALPYLEQRRQVSQEGILLMVPSPYDPRLPDTKQIQKVPAHCKNTGEPMLVTMATYQIGAKQIQRNLPAQCPAVPQVDNQVMRIVVFQDQWQGPWKDFVTRPVKSILEHEVFANQGPDCLMDVWDRQFLSAKMSKSIPSEAATFTVNFRMTIAVAKQIHEASGTIGLFVEPRSADGRTPDSQFQVIWASRKTFAEIRVMQKTLDVPTFLVRHSDRYGLRVEQEGAQKVHHLLKPEIPWIPGTGLLKFRVGPLPYGANRSSLLQVCKMWNWTARPVSPISQSQDRSGTIWLFQANGPPPSWVYQMQHGEILITQEPEPQTQTPTMPTLLASQRTWQSLKRADADKPDDDPWVHEDPWKTKRKEASVGQMQAMEIAMEKRLLEKLQNERTEDVEMPPAVDTRVSQLEQRLETLSSTVANFQAGQAQQNQSVQAQLTQLDAKVDSTAETMSNILDNKLGDHVKRIEQIMMKRGRESAGASGE
eukprot:Skav214539  [mRNA]  locus=scaffold410:584330:588988:+ [translate_table: standard]